MIMQIIPKFKVIWVNFLFPPLCMFLLCKSIRFHVSKSWDWNSVFLIAVQNPSVQALMLYPFETNLNNMKKKKPSLWNITLVGKNNGKGTFLFPELWSFWPAPRIESCGCRPRIMGKHSLYIHKFMRLCRKSEVLWFAPSSYGPT